mgnify:CR=1 FL=1
MSRMNRTCLIYALAPEARCSPRNPRPDGYLALSNDILIRYLECDVCEAFQNTDNSAEKFTSLYDKEFDLIIIATEFNPLSEEDLETIYKFVCNGGSLLILHDAGADGLLCTNTNMLSEKFGMKFNGDFFGCDGSCRDNFISLDKYYEKSSSMVENDSKFGSMCNELYKLYPPDSWKKRFIVENDCIGKIVYWGCSLVCCENADLQLKGDTYHKSLEQNPFKGKKYVPIAFNDKGRYLSNPVILAGRDIGNGKVVCFGGKFVFENSSLCIESHIKLFEWIFNWCTKDSNAVKLPKPSLKVRTKVAYKKHYIIISTFYAFLTIVLGLLAIM